MQKFSVKPGLRFPFGATLDANGVNFSVFSRHAISAELLLFETADSVEPFQIVELNEEVHRTFFAWHVYVEKLGAGVYYNWRMHGPSNTSANGFLFDGNKALVDPWARAVSERMTLS